MVGGHETGVSENIEPLLNHFIPKVKNTKAAPIKNRIAPNVEPPPVSFIVPPRVTANAKTINIPK
jgi:hypothetical protein